MPIRLQAREIAPDFQVEDLFGNLVSLHSNRGSLVLLSFYRNSTSSLRHLHLRINEILEHYPEHKTRFRFIGVFHTKPEQLYNYANDNSQLPFVIIADPKAVLFHLYKIDLSWWQSLSMSLHQSVTYQPNIEEHGLTNIAYNTDNVVNKIPADFLIMADGKIEIAHYGRSVYDHLPFSVIDHYFSGFNTTRR